MICEQGWLFPHVYRVWDVFFVLFFNRSCYIRISEYESGYNTNGSHLLDKRVCAVLKAQQNSQ